MRNKDSDPRRALRQLVAAERRLREAEATWERLAAAAGLFGGQILDAAAAERFERRDGHALFLPPAKVTPWPNLAWLHTLHPVSPTLFGKFCAAEMLRFQWPVHYQPWSLAGMLDDEPATTDPLAMLGYRGPEK